MILTVFTPTFNRKTFLKRGYEALLKQTNKNFIWLIIDDGSTDDTPNLVKEFQKEDNGFEIRYIRKENGGLHTGYNVAIENIDTELCVCIDSDDFMPENAVELILDFWEKNGSENVAGIVGLDYDLDNHVIGDVLPQQPTINLIDLMIGKYNIKHGDRTNVVRTELYKKYAPMKSFPGEKNFNPHYLHLQISKEYDFLVLNRNIRYVEYQQGGMSASIFKQYLNSPNSFAETRRLYLSFANTSLSFKYRQYIHYVSSCILAKKYWSSLKIDRNRLLMSCATIPGVMLSILIRIKGR